MVKTTEFYDFLGVPPTADLNEIKKAYYRKALSCHPDRHPGDETAKETFQKLGKIYAILSHPQKRQDYDRYGEVNEDDEEYEDGDGGDQAEEGEDVAEWLTVEQLEELLKEVGGNQINAAELSKNMDYEASMNPSNLYTLEILNAEIKRAKELEVTEIDFSRKLIEALPESIGELTQLRSLRLGNNKLSSLPDSFASLSKLRLLDLSSNKFTAFPSVLAKLSSLEILLLEHNRLTTLPDLSVLENLTELNLFANKLSAMPDLSNLKKLTRLDLELNSLKEIGAWVEQVENLSIDMSVKVVDCDGKRRALKDRRANTMALASSKTFSFLDALEAEIKENERRKNSAKRKTPPPKKSTKEPPTKKRPTEKRAASQKNGKK